MPVLTLEPTFLPANLFAETERISSEECRWWVLHTKPRTEKTLARLFVSKQIPFFLPLYQQRKQVQRRQVTTHLPLFPGYVFLRGGDEERGMAFETNRIAGCLRVEDQLKLDRDLFQIHKSIESGTPMLPEERIQPGAPAEIVAGPLAGHRGKIVRAGKALRFVIEVDFLQRGVSIELDSSMIRPL